MAQSKNTYAGGLNKDLSKNKYPKDKYFDGRNVKVITEGSMSSGAIETERGTRLSFTIPALSSIYTITRTDRIAPPGTDTITIITSSSTITFTYGTGDLIITNKKLYEALIADPQIQTSIANGEFNLYLNELENQIFIVGLDSSLVVSIIGTDLTLVQKTTPQAGPFLIGAGLIRDKLVLFTTRETAEIPSSSIPGQIWVVEYDEYTDTVKDLSSNNELVPSKHLRYNNNVEFSTYNRLDEGVGRYENQDIQRVYWTDYYNQIRSFNIMDPLGFTIDPSNLNLISDVNLSLPIVKSIGTGSLMTGGVVQYGYRLISQAGGSETAVSPLSAPIVLTEIDPNSSILNGGDFSSGTAFKGNETAGAVAARSVTWTIKDLDLDFNVIEHIAVYWDTINVPQIYKFDEDFIPLDGTIDVTLTGTETETLPLTTDEFNNILSAFICKTITNKDDRLLAGNIKEKLLIIDDYDARAYRSKDPLSNSFDIWTTDDVQFTFNTGNWDTIPEEHDAINPFNDQNPVTNPNWYTDDQYKYQPGTNVLGGAGPNISYKFVNFTHPGNFNFQPFEAYSPSPAEIYDGSAPYVWGVNDPSNPGRLDRNTFVELGGNGRYAIADGPFTKGEEELNNSDLEYPLGLQQNFKNMAGPITQSTYTGYARGEVYRFGIVFHDLQGNPAFVNWIGDIKFPEAYDEGFELSTVPIKTTSDAYHGVDLRQLGIEFTVDVSSVASKISGYSIVRVERTPEQKTRLGTGVLSMWDFTQNGTPDGVVFITNKPQNMAPYVRFSNTMADSGTPNIDYAQGVGAFSGIEIDDWDGKFGQTYIHPSMMSGFTWLCQKGPTQDWGNKVTTFGLRSLVTLHSPLKIMDSNNYSFKDGDHLKTIGYYTALPMCSENPLIKPALQSKADLYRFGTYYKLKHFIKINDPWLAHAVSTGTDPYAGPTGDKNIGFGSFPGTNYFPLTGALRIRKEKTMEQAEAIPFTDSFFAGTSFVNEPLFRNKEAFANDEAWWMNTQFALNMAPIFSEFAGGGKDFALTGFGARKHVLILEEEADPSDWWYKAGDMKYFGKSVFISGFANQNSPSSIHPEYDSNTNSGYREEFNSHAYQLPNIQSFNPNTVQSSTTGSGGANTSDMWNYFKVVSYDRFLEKQYGGDSYLTRQKNYYIGTGHFQAMGPDSTTTKTFQVFGGDVYVNYYTDEYIAPAINNDQNIAGTNFTGYSSVENDETATDGGRTVLHMALGFPCESPVNTELRAGKKWEADRWTQDWDPELISMKQQDLTLLDVYQQETNAKTHYTAQDALTNFSDEYSHRIKVSEAKTDGELLDNWRNFLIQNKIEVEGTHGPINDMINFKGQIMFFQDSGIGILPINEKVLASSQTGSSVTLGTGALIEDYNYITNVSGTIHQHSVVYTGDSVLYWDDRHKKVYKIGGEGGVQPISDIKGLSSYFPTLDGNMNVGDKTLSRIIDSKGVKGSYGVHGVFDIRNERVLMTFLDSNKILTIQPDTKYYPGDIITFGYPVSYYYEASEIIITGNPAIDPDVDLRWIWLVDKDGLSTFENAVTISFNEYIQAFESFLDYKPRIYINAGRRLLSESREVSQDIHEHNMGTYGEFYGKFYDSEITIILNPHADITTVFNNLELSSEVSINDVDQANSTITEMELWNDYQDTGAIPLVVNDSIKRRMRKWRITLPRDQQGARLRNPYVFLRLKFNNTNNKRLILHDIILHSIPTNG